jgi:hypothetical protein
MSGTALVVGAGIACVSVVLVLTFLPGRAREQLGSEAVW